MQEIREAVAELLKEIAARNASVQESCISILLSNTEDIRSLYPAKAAREAGFSGCALFSAQEPSIDGALPLCIRVLVLAEGDAPVRHVYLRGAANLRKDLSRYSIALDGPSGSGKSTVAKRLARELDILYLDTGAMYRACACKASEAGVDLSDESAVEAMLSSLDLRIEYRGGAQHTILDGRDVSEEIRRPEVSMAASKISALGCVRKKMVEMQRKIAAGTSCVLDGRDIGSAVLPDAKFKFFLTADSGVRALRRQKELAEKGQNVDFERLKEEIEKRDKQDSEREFSPLKRAEDAVVVDTSDMDIEEVVAKVKSLIQSKI